MIRATVAVEFWSVCSDLSGNLVTAPLTTILPRANGAMDVVFTATVNVLVTVLTVALVIIRVGGHSSWHLGEEVVVGFGLTLVVTVAVFTLDVFTINHVLINLVMSGLRRVGDVSQRRLDGGPTCRHFSIVVPTFGRRGFVQRNIRSILERACPGFRIVTIGSNSDSGAKVVLSRLTERRPRLHIVRRRGRNGSITVGRTLGRFTANSLVVILSTSSCLAPATLAGVTQHFSSPELLKTDTGIHVAHPRGLLRCIRGIRCLLNCQLGKSRRLLKVITMSTPLFTDRQY